MLCHVILCYDLLCYWRIECFLLCGLTTLVISSELSLFDCIVWSASDLGHNYNEVGQGRAALVQSGNLMAACGFGFCLQISCCALFFLLLLFFIIIYLVIYLFIYLFYWTYFGERIVTFCFSSAAHQPGMRMGLPSWPCTNDWQVANGD